MQAYGVRVRVVFVLRVRVRVVFVLRVRVGEMARYSEYLVEGVEVPYREGLRYHIERG